MGKNVYSSETRWAVVKDKMSGQLTAKEIMETHGIKNKSQIETWMRWYRANEIHHDRDINAAKNILNIGLGQALVR